MRRAARPLLYLGIVGAVVGLSHVPRPRHRRPAVLLHGHVPLRLVARLHRACSSVTAYGFGLPELPRSPRQALVTLDRRRRRAGALAISLLQLFVGDALLPRFVVFGAAILLVPWYLLCAALAADGGRRRPAAIGCWWSATRPARRCCARRSARGAERPADRDRGRARSSRVEPTGRRRPAARRAARRATGSTCWCSTARRRRAADRGPGRRRCTRRASGCARSRCSTRSGSASCRCPSSSGCRCMFDIGEVHRAPLRPGQAGHRPGARRCVGLPVLLLAIPFVRRRRPGRATAARCSTASRGSARTARCSASQVPHHAGRARRQLPTEWTAEDDPRITRSAGCCG